MKKLLFAFMLVSMFACESEKEAPLEIVPISDSAVRAMGERDDDSDCIPADGIPGLREKSVK